MVSTTNWVLLTYRLPREPSTPRIAVWRRLKRLGVAQIGDGLVGLPFDPATKESLEWVANMVLEADGEATVWLASPSLRRDGRELAAELTRERAEEYRTLMDRITDLGAEAPARSVAALRAEMRRIERRDYFPPPERAQARSLLDQLESTAGSIR